jgi:hypothetical protein
LLDGKTNGKPADAKPKISSPVSALSVVLAPEQSGMHSIKKTAPRI